MQIQLDANKAARLLPFGPVWDGAGVRGFSGEGYWYHPLVPGLSFSGSTFVTKTITTYPRKGNTPLTGKFTPRALFPNSIVLYMRKGMALNSVGLSGPGIRRMLTTERWQEIKEPFFISYMPVLGEEELRASWEVHEFVHDMKKFLPYFLSRQIGIQLNVSCPNVGANLAAIVKKAHRLLDLLQELQLPVLVKLNLLVSPETARHIAEHPACTGLCIANSLPFGELIPKSWWDKNFPNGSPLQERGFGDGGLSGAPLLPLVRKWVSLYRQLDTSTYINAGGGILHKRGVNELYSAGANSIFLSSAAMLRPSRVRGIIRHAHTVFAK